MLSIEALANRIICEAVEQNATDIHITPKQKESVLQFRIANHLINHLVISANECDKLISHFKFTASMDIGERRKPQNGSISTTVKGQYIGLRLSTLPSHPHESLVIRILSDQNMLPIYHISLFPNISRKLISLLKHAHGLIILTGPTGSGKTTTLYSLLNENAHLYQRNVISLEDPIEKTQENVLQIQVNEKAGITYSTGLKAILRHDPDIIMVGEIRDKETAHIAIRASLTGHLVLSTMHTRDAKGAIHRLLEFGIKETEIEQTLIAITAQRLVEMVCPFCDKDCSPNCYRLDNRLKRSTVFEMITGRMISDILYNRTETKRANYKSLGDIICKGIALGYIKKGEYERWIYDEK
ncbi:type II/IV secretion system protein [Bacillus circulans]|uniref:Competence protein ComG n=1 Tax=Niallia circulans TaxID=1397 RepID=A0AA91TP92_NIACI|nr:competence type IV pilus ATPase ComGA [Niallia circulans]NRG28167.1 type II/IV secretion system protein [Niallia circulans]PAD81522.1 competence protein ComG [Niallia circulans]